MLAVWAAHRLHVAVARPPFLQRRPRPPTVDPPSPRRGSGLAPSCTPSVQHQPRDPRPQAQHRPDLEAVVTVTPPADNGTVRCAVCLGPVPPSVQKRIYCSNSCKQTARRRKAGIPPHRGRASRLNWQRCAWCDGWFVKRYRVITCSDNCRAERKKRLAQQDHRARYVSRSVTNPEARHVCPECGASFTSTRYSNQRIYCSTPCTARAAHRTRRHRERQAQREGEHFTTR